MCFGITLNGKSGQGYYAPDHCDFDLLKHKVGGSSMGHGHP